MVGKRFSRSWRTENTKTVMDDTMELLDLDDNISVAFVLCDMPPNSQPL